MTIEVLAYDLMHDNDLDGQSTLRDNGVSNACDLALFCHELENVSCADIPPDKIGFDSSIAEIRILIETRRATRRATSASACQSPAFQAIPLVMALT